MMRWRSFCTDDDGVAAIEFALLAPLAVLGLVAMADVGLAVRDRMALDHIVRAASLTATENLGEDAVLFALNAAAHGSLTRSSSAAALSVGAIRECACPEAPAVAVACMSTCAQQQPTVIFYTLRADTVAAGLLLPGIALASRARVQIR